MIDYTKDIKNSLLESSDLTEDEINVLSNDTNITSLGVDSLSLVEMIISLEDKFKVEIDLGGAWETHTAVTINDINEILNKALPQPDCVILGGEND